MKRFKILTTTILMLTVAFVLGGCTEGKVLNKLTEKGYFTNSYDDAILQTDISGIITSHFTKGSIKKKAMLITIDGFRAEALEYMMSNDLGIAPIAKEGGLYWTKPANLETKAKIDICVNFLSVVTGHEPSTFDVLKNTDVKRDTPYTIMTQLSDEYRVKFLTDNAYYINVQLEAEVKNKKSPRLSLESFNDIDALRNASKNSMEDNDFVALAISTPYYVGNGNFKLSNEEYLATIINLNYYLRDIYSAVQERSNEDWLFVVATTCGGKTKLGLGNSEGNILTFMLSNKKLEV